MEYQEVPAVFMRGGTSKGLFFLEGDLPESVAERDRLFLAALGSPDPYGRQLDGMGGGLSSLSKVMVIHPPSRSDVDVDYTFGQVAVDRLLVDYGSNCGNLSSAVGPFAVDAGLLELPDGEATVRMYNRNSGQVLHATFPVQNGRAQIHGSTAIPGVAGTGAEVRLAFTDPAGSGTAGLLPGAGPRQKLTVGAETISVSLVDAATPVVFIAADDVGLHGHESPDFIESRPGLMEKLDRIRRAGGVAMGMASEASEVSPMTPRLGIVSAPQLSETLDGQQLSPDSYDIGLRTVSMERLHRAAPLTVSLCLGVAAQIAETLPASVSLNRRGPVRIGTPSGILQVDSEVSASSGVPEVTRAVLHRTARCLMRGTVVVPAAHNTHQI